MHILDYNRCSAINTAAVDGIEVNTCRTRILARCELTDEESGQHEDFYLGKACIGENMYVGEDITQLPPSEVSIIFHERYYKLIKKAANHKDDIVQVQPHDKKVQRHDGKYVYWTDFSLDLKNVSARPLETADEIVKATLEDEPMVGRTTVADRDRKWRAVLEYPIIYMNVHVPSKRFGVDVGPVLFPDFSSTATPLISRMELAYIMYQRLDRAEFAVRVATRLTENDGPETSHYSKIIIMEAKNELFSHSK